MGYRIWLWILLSTFVVGCGDKDTKVAHESAWSTAAAAFGSDFFDESARKKWFTGAAREQLVLPDLVKPERYQYLGLAELRWMGLGRRQGEVAFSIDGWPATMMVQMTRVKNRWQFVQVSPPAQQERLVELLGPDGFPIVRGATHWTGGFAGRDAAGRPTASIMVVAHRAGTFVDGLGPFAHEAAPVKAALRDAMKTRAALAERAHAVYRSQAAIAVGRRQPVQTLVDLADWASGAGIEGLQLVARTTEGKPAWIPLARKAAAPPGARPKLLQVAVGKDATELVSKSHRESIPHVSGKPDPKMLAFKLVQAAQKMKDTSGGLLRVKSTTQVDAVAKLLIAVSDAMPETPFAVEVDP